jgi:hypothetical protein
MHLSLGQQLEDGGADIAALAASSPAAATAARSAWAEAESAAGVKSELEASAWAEAATGFEAGTRVVLAKMIT